MQILRAEVKPKLFDSLSQHGVDWALTWLDPSTGSRPVAAVRRAKQDQSIAVPEHHVRTRGMGFCDPPPGTDRSAAISVHKPVQPIGSVKVWVDAGAKNRGSLCRCRAGTTGRLGKRR